MCLSYEFMDEQESEQFSDVTWENKSEEGVGLLLPEGCSVDTVNSASMGGRQKCWLPRPTSP